VLFESLRGMDNLVLIGPLEYKLDATKTGGAIVQFKHVLEGLSAQNKEYLIIDTNKNNYVNRWVAFFRILTSYLKLINKNRVVVYFTSTNYVYCRYSHF
jgi:hypothetical protein